MLDENYPTYFMVKNIKDNLPWLRAVSRALGRGADAAEVGNALRSYIEKANPAHGNAQYGLYGDLIKDFLNRVNWTVLGAEYVAATGRFKPLPDFTPPLPGKAVGIDQTPIYNYQSIAVMTHILKSSDDFKKDITEAVSVGNIIQDYNYSLTFMEECLIDLYYLRHYPLFEAQSIYRKIAYLELSIVQWREIARLLIVHRGDQTQP